MFAGNNLIDSEITVYTKLLYYSFGNKSRIIEKTEKNMLDLIQCLKINSYLYSNQIYKKLIKYCSLKKFIIMNRLIELPAELLIIIANNTNNIINLNSTCKTIRLNNLVTNLFFLYSEEFDNKNIITFDLKTVKTNNLQGLRIIETKQAYMTPEILAFTLINKNIFSTLRHLEIPYWIDTIIKFINLKYLKVNKYANTQLILPEGLLEADIGFNGINYKKFEQPNNLTSLTLRNCKNCPELSDTLVYLKLDSYNSIIKCSNIAHLEKLRTLELYGSQLDFVCPKNLQVLKIYSGSGYLTLPETIEKIYFGKKSIHRIINPIKLSKLKVLSIENENYVERNNLSRKERYIPLELDTFIGPVRFKMFYKIPKTIYYIKTAAYITNNVSKIIIQDDGVTHYKTDYGYLDEIPQDFYHEQEVYVYSQDIFDKTVQINFLKNYIILQYNEIEHSFTVSVEYPKLMPTEEEFIKLKINSDSRTNYCDNMFITRYGHSFVTERDRVYNAVLKYRNLLTMFCPEVSLLELGKLAYGLEELNIYDELVDRKKYIVSRDFDFSKLKRPIKKFTTEQIKISLNNSKYKNEIIQEMERSAFDKNLKKM